MTNTPIPSEIATEDLANLINVDARTVRNLVSRGVITKSGRGKHPLAASIQAILSDAKRQGVPKVETEARARLLSAKSEEIGIRTAARKRELIPMDDALAAVSNICAMIREGLDGLAARVTRDIPMRKKIEAATDDVLRKTSERCERIATVLAEGGDPFEAR